MMLLYVGLGAALFWAAIALIALIVCYVICQVLDGCYVAFAWWQMARANRGALHKGYSPRHIAWEAWKKHVWEGAPQNRNVVILNGGALNWSGPWRWKVTAGDPDWRPGDASKALRQRHA